VTNPALGSSVIFSGSVTPKAVGATVWFSIRPTGGTWSNLSSVVTDSQSKFSYNWICDAYGSFEVKASWAGNGSAPAAESNTVTIIVPSGNRHLTLSAYPSNVVSGDYVTVSGSVSPPSRGVQVSLYLRVSSGSWTLLAQVQSDSAGAFTYNWHAVGIGTYQVKAVISSDQTGGAAESSPSSVSVNMSIAENPSGPTMIALTVSVALVTTLSLILVDLNRKPKRKVPKTP
jgi:hypothetical protein